MGMSGTQKSQVSRHCEEIDEWVGAFLEHAIEGRWPYLWLDATCLRVRRTGRVVGAILAEQSDKWAACRRYMPLETLAQIKESESGPLTIAA